MRDITFFILMFISVIFLSYCTTTPNVKKPTLPDICKGIAIEPEFETYDDYDTEEEKYRIIARNRAKRIKYINLLERENKCLRELYGKEADEKQMEEGSEKVSSIHS